MPPFWSPCNLVLRTPIPARPEIQSDSPILVRPTMKLPWFTAGFGYDCKTALYEFLVAALMNPGRSAGTARSTANPALYELFYDHVYAPALPSCGVFRRVLNRRNAVSLL